MNHARPQTRQVRDHGQAKSRPQLRAIHVRDLSASAIRPRQQAREQSVHIRGNDAALTGHNADVATDIDTPQTDCIRERAAVTVATLTDIESGNQQVKRCPIHRFAVDILPPISFPVRIRHNPAYVRL
jgi:hypothetical protein